MIAFNTQYITDVRTINKIARVLNLKDDEDRYNAQVKYDCPLIQLSAPKNSVARLLHNIINTRMPYQLHARIALFLQLTYKKRIEIILHNENLTTTLKAKRSQQQELPSTSTSNRNQSNLAATSSDTQNTSQRKRTAMDTWLNPNL